MNRRGEPSEIATPLPAGSKAPDFELPSTPDQSVSLDDFRGRPVILAFYPADWSPVCSDQMGLYQAVLSEFEKFNADAPGEPSFRYAWPDPTAMLSSP